MPPRLSAILNNLLHSLSANETIDTSDWERAIESHFNIHLPTNLTPTPTLADVAALIKTQLHLAGQSLTDDQIWTTLRAITSNELGIDKAELHPTTRLKEDLCI